MLLRVDTEVKAKGVALIHGFETGIGFYPTQPIRERERDVGNKAERFRSSTVEIGRRLYIEKGLFLTVQ